MNIAQMFVVLPKFTTVMIISFLALPFDISKNDQPPAMPLIVSQSKYNSASGLPEIDAPIVDVAIQPKEEILSISRQIGIYKVFIHYKIFNKREHKLYIRDGVVWPIDGVEPSGTDGTMPEVEIVSIRLFIGNKEYKFPKSQYGSLFDPHLDIGDRKFVSTTFGITEEKDRVKIYLSGGDGGSAYDVRWFVNKRNNKIIRYLNEFPNFETAKKRISRLIPATR